MSDQFLKLRRSAVPGKIPTTSSIDFGEIALNTYDGLAFMKKSGSLGMEIVTLGAGSTSGSYTGSFSGSFTGSLQGTASYAISSVSSSYPIAVTGSTLYSKSPAAGPNLNTYNSIFLGDGAGYQAIEASYSNFFGYQAGYNATNAFYSNLLGIYAGNGATYAYGSNFLGNAAGYQATNADNSNFLGVNAGNNAIKANNSNFLGKNAGYLATSASYSTLIGYQVGYNVIGGGGLGVKSNNIIIGTNITLPDGAQDSINLGGIIFATGSYSTTTGDPFSGAVTGRVGINNDIPLYPLDVTGVIRGSSDAIINNITVGKGPNSLTYNTVVGELALNSITSGDFNLAFGYQSQRDTTTGNNNVSFGFNSLALNVGGEGNTAFGTNTLRDNSGAGNYNTAIGLNASLSNISGVGNLSIGNEALLNNTAGNYNIAFGYRAGRYYNSTEGNLTNAQNSILIGANTSPLGNTQTNQIVIGYDSIGLGSNTTIIGNASTVTTAIRGNTLIGTTTDAGEKLQIAGTSRFTGNGRFYAALQVDGYLTLGTAIDVNSLTNIRLIVPGAAKSVLINSDYTNINAASAILDVQSTTKGFLTPRMTLTQRNAIASPAEGLLVYVTGSGDGFSYYNRGSNPGWQTLLSNSGSQSISGSLTITGTLTAQTIIAQTITSSTLYSSGSNIFGNSLLNTQVFTGSVSITGSLALNGNTVITSNQTSSMSVLSASFASTSSFATSASWSPNNLVGGTTNYVPLWSSSTSLTSSIIFQSGSNISMSGSLNVSDIIQASGSLSGSLLDMSQTWNTAGNVTAIKLNAISTLSGASSNLIDLQVGGTSMFYVSKAGYLRTVTLVSSGVVSAQGGAVYIGSSKIESNGSGILALKDSPETSFNRLQFGGTTSSYPAIKRVSGSIAIVDAADGVAANLLVGTITDAGYKLDVLGTTRFTGNSLITGNLNVTSAITASQALISGSGTQRLIVVGSGSAQPIFTVQGSQGELFSITDSLSGSLFSVNDISGLPILETFSDSTTLLGSYLAPALFTTQKTTTTNSGSFIIYNIPTGSYDGLYIDYTARSGSNARAGQIMAIWSGSSVNFTETTTTDFGTTSNLLLGVSISGSNMALTGSVATGSGWVIKSIIRSI